MINIDTWPPWIAITVAGVPFLLSLVCSIYNLYLIHNHLDAMMDALKNSRFIYLWGPVWRSRGAFFGFMLLGKIAGMVIFPQAYIRIGDAAPDDIKNFPAPLKRLLIINTALMIFILAWTGVVATLVKLRQPI
jgi:hypothetical protein